MTLIVPIIFSFKTSYNNSEIIELYIILFDMFTNLICSVMSYRCCGCIHNKCKIFWYFIVKKCINNNQNIVNQLQAN